MTEKYETYYAYDDISILPQFSDIRSRSEVDLRSVLGNGIVLNSPIITSPMDTVSEDMMAIKMNELGGLAVVHRYNSIQQQSEMIDIIAAAGGNAAAAAVGTTGDFLERATELVLHGANIICIDVAHGHHILMKEAIEAIKNKFSDIHIMAGNVATEEGVRDLESWGADSIRCLISNGSICSTNLTTAVGSPAFTTIQKCAGAAKKAKIIADGGIKGGSEIVKALAVGADFVMVGSLFSGTTETPGKIYTNPEGQKYKVYRGMSSRESQMDWREKSNAPEGISTTVPYRGPVEPLWNDVIGNVKSGLSYVGARNIKELQQKAKFILRTNSGLKEADTHILNRRF